MDILTTGLPKKNIDFQRERLYRFELVHLYENRKVPNKILTQEQIKAAIRNIMYEYGQEHVPIALTWYEDDKAICDINRTEGLIHFNFPKFYRRGFICLHEIAHAFTPNHRHGPAFVAQYFDLLAKYMKMDYKQLVQEAQDFTWEGRSNRLLVGSRSKVLKRVRASHMGVIAA